jgi:hypothetical protein
MHSHARALAPLRILLLRALVAYPLLRLLLFVVTAIVADIAGGSVADGLESPLGVVLLAMALGAVDIRRRGETILWADLGYSPIVAPSLFALTAMLGELLLALVRS